MFFAAEVRYEDRLFSESDFVTGAFMFKTNGSVIWTKLFRHINSSGSAHNAGRPSSVAIANHEITYLVIRGSSPTITSA